MTTSYHLYKNDSAGGAVDYTTIVTTTASLTYTPAALPTPSDTTFAVRAFDTVSGLEEANTDARVRIVLDSSGNNITNRPNAPTGLTATPTKGGGVALFWQYVTAGQLGAPIGFHIYTGTPTPSFGSPAATVPFATGRQGFTANLSGFTNAVTYEVVVRAYNATAEEPNSNAASFTASSTGPLPVANLAGSAVV